MIEFLGPVFANFFTRRLNAAVVPQTVCKKFTRPSGTFFFGVIRITDAFFKQIVGGVLASIFAVGLRVAVLLNAGLEGMARPCGTLGLVVDFGHAVPEYFFGMSLAAFLAGRLDTAVFAEAPGQELAGPCSTRFFISLRERHALLENVLRVLGAMSFAISEDGRITVMGGDQIDGLWVYDGGPRQAADELLALGNTGVSSSPDSDPSYSSQQEDKPIQFHNRTSFQKGMTH